VLQGQAGLTGEEGMSGKERREKAGWEEDIGQGIVSQNDVHRVMPVTLVF